ncbi:ABC transporter ATP-binding protein [Halobacteriales archaeon Cl-PHB]
MSLLEVEDIHTYYGESHILEGVTIDVEQDEVVALMGRNGVGKTTTIRSILQLTPPRTGTIRYDGTDLVGKKTHQVADLGIGWIPEERRIFGHLSVEENLSAAIPDEDQIDTGLEAAFDTFPILRERRGQEAGTLSGGQQQMLAIARGLVGDNDMLLVDEPSEGLAPQIVADVAEALEEVSEHVPLLLVEQNVHMALDLADRFYVLDHGQVVDQGDTSEVSADSDRLTEVLSA